MALTSNSATLYDYDTGEDLGPATPEQHAASNAMAELYGTGAFLIDAEGRVTRDGTWDAQQPGVRVVFTS